MCAQAALFFTPLSICAQSLHFDEDWRWVHFTTESGLPSDRVLQVYDAPDGTEWASTAAGLAWFDGFQWQPVDSTSGIPSGVDVKTFGVIRDSLIVRVNGSLFLGTKAGFRKLSAPDVTEALPLQNGTLLISSHGALFVYDGLHMTPFPPAADVTVGSGVRIWKTRSGALWIGAADGLFRLEGGRMSPVLKTTPGRSGPEQLAENSSGDGLTIVPPTSEGAGVWEWKTGSRPVHSATQKPDVARAIDVGPAGEAIVVYQSGDVRIRRGGVWSAERFSHPEVRDITSVSYKPTSDLWITTEHGLFLYRRSSSRWKVLKHESPDLRNTVNEIMMTRQGVLWAGTSDGLDIYGPGGANRHVDAIQGTPLGAVTGLAEDRRGRIWVSSGSSFSGAFCWDGAAWKHLAVGGGKEGLKIHKIKPDRRGRLWFLGLGPFASSSFSDPGGAFILENDAFVPWGRNAKLPSGRVYSFAEHPDGSLWFGTWGALSRWKQGAWTHWTERDGLRSARVFCLAVDRDGKVWFGASTAHGLGTIGEDDRIRYLTTADGLLDNRIWDMKVDSTGELWISTDAGLCTFKDGAWSTYDRRSGLVQPSLWPVLPLNDRVYAGTRGNGIAILRREEITTPNPRITIDQTVSEDQTAFIRWKAFSFGGELEPDVIQTRYRLDRGDWSSWGYVREAVVRSLEPGDHTVTVQAKGLFGNFTPEGRVATLAVPLPTYLRPAVYLPLGGLMAAVIVFAAALVRRRVKFSQELRRSEAKFRAVTENTSSAIFIFREGDLLFVNEGAVALTRLTREELAATSLLQLVHPEDRNEVKEWLTSRSGRTQQPKRFEVRIASKPGEVRWIDMSIGWMRYQDMPVSLATAFDITDRKHAEERLRALGTELALTEERERRRMATYLHDVIIQTLAFSKIRIRELEKSADRNDIDARLGEIRGLIDQVITESRSLTFELSPPILYKLKFEPALESLAEQILEPRGISVIFEDDGQPKPLGHELRVVLFHAVREMLVNTVKHAEASEVRISVSKSCESIRISVEDNGKGFDSAADPAMGPEGGFGLFNVQERVHHLGGTFAINSSQGKGTRLTLTAPLAAGGETAGSGGG